jgi:hypothetical protein
MVVFILFFFNPTKTLKPQGRRWMTAVLVRILITPLSYVTFADFWVADQLNSIQPIFPDIFYWFCFYQNLGHGPANSWYLATDDSQCLHPAFTTSDWSLLYRFLLGCLPAYFRLVHCLRRYRDTRHSFPHLYNAGKYSSGLIAALFHFASEAAITVMASNTLYGFYLGFKAVSSLYALIWDLKMDWGFFASDPGENKWLREETVYPSTTYYYLAGIQDVILRFLWVPALFLKKVAGVPPEAVTCVQQVAEVFRRFIWNFFRLENEHLNNCGQFRVVRNISIAPVDVTDQEELIRMMEEDFGAHEVLLTSAHYFYLNTVHLHKCVQWKYYVLDVRGPSI